MNPIDPAAFEKLGSEVAELRQQLNALRRFLTVEEADEESRESLIIRCTTIVLETREKSVGSERLRGMIVASPEGSEINLWAEDSRGRVSLKAENKSGYLALSGSALKPAVELWVDNEDNGIAFVYSGDGKPRAGLKAMADAGVVNAVAGDGTVRALLRGTDEKGEICVAGPELKMCVKLAGTPTGGMMTVHDVEGMPKVALTTNEDKGGMAIVNDGNGHMGVAIGTSAAANSVQVFRGAAEDGPERRAVCLMALRDAGGSIDVFDKSGADAIRMITTESGGSMEIQAHDGSSSIAMHGGESSSIAVKHRDSESSVLISASEKNSLVSARTADGLEIAVLQGTENRASVNLLQHERDRVSVAIGTSEDGHGTIHLQNSENNHGVSLFAHENGGSVLVCGVDGSTQAGMTTSPAGGHVSVRNDLGIERVALGVADDGGLMKLNWGGTMSVAAVATHHGGNVFVNDERGEIAATLPPNDDNTWTDDDEDD